MYDPVLDFPPDEYDCLPDPLLTRLSRGDSGTQRFLWHEIEDHFGLDPLSCRSDAFAEQTLAWYAVKVQQS